jgi:hypothetical protein
MQSSDSRWHERGVTLFDVGRGHGSSLGSVRHAGIR